MSKSLSVTPGQRRAFLLAHLEADGGTAGNLPLFFELSGPLDAGDLARTWSAAGARFEELQSRLELQGDQVVRTVVPGAEPLWESARVSDAGLEQALDAFVRPFDLGKAPVFRSAVFTTETRTVWAVDSHAAVTDEPTLRRLLADWAASIDGREAPKPARAKKAAASADREEARRFWMGQFASVPVLELPIDRGRSQVRDFTAASRNLAVPKAVHDAVQKAAARTGIAEPDFYLAAWSLVLARFAGPEEVVIGVLEPGESALPLRLPFDLAQVSSAYLTLVAGKLSQARHHRAFPVEDLIEALPQDRTSNRSPLFDVAFHWAREAEPLTLGGRPAAPWIRPPRAVARDLTLEGRPAGTSVGFRLDGASALFHPETLDRYLQAFLAAASGLADAADPAVGSFGLIAEADRRLILETFNGTDAPFPRDKTVMDLFLDQAKKTPDAPALRFLDQTMTYTELDRRSWDIAVWLLDQGLKPDERVGVFCERSFEMMTSIYGILRAGGAYVPLDPHYPEDRWRYMVEDSAARFLLAQQKFLPLVSGLEEVTAAAAETIPPAPAGGPTPGSRATPEGMAYVIYTSGSTGRPKGVMVDHRPVVNRLNWGARHYPATGTDVFLQKTTYTFDVSVWELFTWFHHGGCLVMLVPGGEKDPEALLATVEREKVTRIHFVPSMFNAFLDYVASTGEKARLSTLRWIQTSGEALAKEQVRKSDALFKEFGTQVANLYGPTETTVEVSYFDCVGDINAGSVPIGKPIDNVKLYVVDARNNLLPIGVAGELCIGGDCLARGYQNREELTAEKFVADPFNPGGKMYRTGDLCRWLADGEVEYLGRIDNQVKIRGFRIELGEIENCMLLFPGIRTAVVTAPTDSRGGRYLAGYFEGDPGTDLAALRVHLGKTLPEYMVPDRFLRLETIPLTSSGKADRKALPVIAASESPAAAVEAPAPAASGSLEETIAAVWCELLGVATVPRDTPFFQIGGTSILAIQMSAKLRAATGLTVPVTTIFDHATVRKLADHLSGGTKPQAAAPTSVPLAAGEPIAIIGWAGRFPGAGSVDELWTMLLENRAEQTTFVPSDLDPSLDPEVVQAPGYVMARGILDNVETFDAEYFGIPPREAEVLDPQQKIFLEVVIEALENAGYDQRRYPGEIGLYAGSGNTTYLNNHLNSHPEVEQRIGSYPVRVGNEKDFVVIRAAHLLGLRGPALAVNTACSTGLVAVGQAVNALRAGDCDLALAGGITIVSPANSGSVYAEGGMQSQDGYTRSFDAGSEGTSFNDGAALVVLKPLSRALADGDQVHAVIRSVGLNNDGSDKMSFFGPSLSGQAAAIRKAHKLAGIDPSTISYIEAHGTATPIGDPIEVGALTAAFRQFTDRKGFCALSSVKSNIGHTISAAGAAGLIKTALALKTETLPGTAHFEKPNPLLDLENSPFWVVPKTQPWPRAPRPLRAGVSSFGWGGTNAHAVVEQAPEVPAGDAAPGPQVLLVSARTPQALEAACGRLATHLEAHPDQNLADTAWTLQEGRNEHRWRTHVAASTAAEAANRLRSAAGFGREALPGPGVAFLFPGQGAQYGRMGLQLLETSPAFRKAFRDCDAVLQPLLGESLEQILAAGGDRLTQTRYTQPALFTLEYSLARHWQSWGVHPRAAMGHSVGEFVAAALAEVMDPADAVRLVALRGRFVDECPPGSMLAVRLSAEDLRPLLPADLDIAAENAPLSQVVSGPREAIEAFAKTLEGLEIPSRNLKTSHGFHSRMMEPAVEAFQRELAGLKLQAPKLPFVSTLTGTWITADEARSPDYWGRHLRQTVKFSAALKTLAAEGPAVFLEVGPQSTLVKLAQQHPECRGRALVASLSDDPALETETLLSGAGGLWRSGVAVNWKDVHGGARRLKVALPTYPFQRKRFWIDAASRTPSAMIVKKEIVAMSVPTHEDRLFGDLFKILDDLTGLVFDRSHAQNTFADLGLDSLQLTQVAQVAAKTFKVPLKLRQFVDEYPTPEALVRYLSPLVAPAAAPAPAPVAAVPLPLVAAPASPAPAAAVPAAVASAPRLVVPAAPLVFGQGVEGLFQQQLDIMRQQIAVLSGGGYAPGEAAPVPAAPAPAAASAPATAAPAAPAPAPEAPAGPIRPHGPQLVIDRTTKKELSPTQEKCLKSIQERYIQKTKKSREFTVRARPHIADPRSVAGFKPQMKEVVYPIVAQKSLGAHIWDVDGNEYVDLLSGYGSNFFGFGAPFVKEAIAKQMEVSMEIGPQAHLIERFATLFKEFVPMDRLAFCNTGSEAVLAALRMARTATGKDLIVMFNHGYHGIFDEVIVRPAAQGRSVPAAPGIPRASVENVIVLEWNDESTLEIIRQRADDIAAVITEPVQSRSPEIQPVEFLRKLRKVTKENGIAMIMDEVVTGFRVAPGGAQEFWGIDADLATYGKVIGGGLSLGVVAGKKEFMDTLDGGAWQYGDDSVPEVGVTYFAGTFVRHPIMVAVGIAVLEYLKEHGPGVQKGLTEKTNAWVKRMNDLFIAEEAPVRIYNFASVIKIDADKTVPFYELLFILLRMKGIHTWDGRPNFMTLAHTEADLDKVFQAFQEAIAELQDGGFYPKPAKQLKADQPPVPGARLGRNPAGQPAWFVPDPKNAGQYIELK